MVDELHSDDRCFEVLALLTARENILARLKTTHLTGAWLQDKSAIYVYGPSHFARNVQLIGLQDAARDWGIPFHLVYEGRDGAFLSHPPAEEDALVITSDSLLARIPWLTKRPRCRVLVWGRYYNDSPNHGLCPLISPTEVASLERHRPWIVGVLSEFSLEGNKHYLRGYVDDLGLPVMAFPWGANALRHFPVEGELERDVVFLGSYFEKPNRINAYFGPILARHRFTIIGAGWSCSPFAIGEGMLPDFNHAAPYFYSLHAVSLNIHHPFEASGYSCNERTFNSIACGGFQICDNARRVREFFTEHEVLQAQSPEEYAELVDHFSAHPEERIPYMRRAQARVSAEHTYHHRLADLLRFALTGTPESPYCSVLKA